MPALSGIDLLIRWLQIVISLAYPIIVATVLFLAWRDFHRWVNHQVEAEKADIELEAEVREFLE